MFGNENQDTFRLVLKAFSEAARANYGTHAFESGYLQSLAVQMLGVMPKKHQRQFIDDMVRATQKQEQEVVKKINENRVVDRVAV
jgi:hypothetical protein